MYNEIAREISSNPHTSIGVAKQLYTQLEKDFESFITSKLNDIFKSKNNVDEHSPVIFVDENKSINKTTL